MDGLNMSSYNLSIVHVNYRVYSKHSANVCFLIAEILQLLAESFCRPITLYRILFNQTLKQYRGFEHGFASYQILAVPFWQFWQYQLFS